MFRVEPRVARDTGVSGALTELLSRDSVAAVRLIFRFCAPQANDMMARLMVAAVVVERALAVVSMVMARARGSMVVAMVAARRFLPSNPHYRNHTDPRQRA